MSLRQALYRGFMPGFRGRRFADFRRRLDVHGGERILDVGGYPADWDGTGLGGMVICLNLDIEDDASNPGRDPAPLRGGVTDRACPSTVRYDGGRRPVGAGGSRGADFGHDGAAFAKALRRAKACPSSPRCDDVMTGTRELEGAAPSAPEIMAHGSGARPGVPRRVRGDARDLPFADGAFDVAFSNSVIEHVGAWEDQCRFAAEIRRVAPRLWVQTPNRWFPVEPHFVAPMVHFLPRRAQPVVARWATPWGWENRPTAEQARAFVGSIRLLTFREMRELFPDCEILRERWMGMTKSFIAVRGKV